MKKIRFKDRNLVVDYSYDEVINEIRTKMFVFDRDKAPTVCYLGSDVLLFLVKNNEVLGQSLLPPSRVFGLEIIEVKKDGYIEVG